MYTINILPYGILLFAVLVSFFRKGRKIGNNLLAVLFLAFGVFCAVKSGWWGFGYFVLLAGLVQENGPRTYALVAGFCFINMLFQWIWGIFDWNPVVWQTITSAYGGLLIFACADVA